MSFFKKVTNWFFVNNIDTLKTEGISYGSLLQVELYHYFNANAFIYKRKVFENKLFKTFNIKHICKIIWSHFFSINKKFMNSDVLLVYDTDNKFTIKSLNIFGLYLESKGISVTALICSPFIVKECKISTQISPKLFFSLKNLIKLLKISNKLFINFKKNKNDYLLNGLNKKILYYVKIQLPLLVFENINLNNLLNTVNPNSIILGNDCHRTSRLITQISTKNFIKSYVIQHGLTTWKYGYLPLFADHIFVWGNYFEKWFLNNGVSSKKNYCFR